MRVSFTYKPIVPTSFYLQAMELSKKYHFLVVLLSVLPKLSAILRKPAMQLLFHIYLEHQKDYNKNQLYNYPFREYYIYVANLR